MKTSLVILYSLASAAHLMADDCLDYRISQLEEKMREIHECTELGRAGAKFSCAKPPLNCWGVFYVTGDALYWKMFEGGTEYVYTDINREIALPALQLVSGKSKQIDFNWNWGYRVGAAYVFPSNCWGLYLNYTSVRNKGSSAVTRSPGGNLIPLYLTYTLPQANEAQSHWKIDFSSLDLELGRSFFLSQYLNVRTHIGLKGARINQNVNAHYVDIEDELDSTVTVKNDFQGVGLRAGFDSQWFLKGHFSLFLDASASILWGRFHVRYIENAIFPAFPALGDLNDHIRFMVPAAQGMLGFGWETSINSRYYLAFKAGYETQYWWRQNQIPHDEGTIVFPYGKRIADDLSMHGLTLKAELDF